MAKFLTGILIVGIIYMYINKMNDTVNAETQTEEEPYSQQVDLSTIEEEPEEEYIHQEESFLEQVEELSDTTSTNCIDTTSTDCTDFNQMSVIELKEMAKIQNIKGYSRMKKSDLIEKLSF